MLGAFFLVAGPLVGACSTAGSSPGTAASPAASVRPDDRHAGPATPTPTPVPAFPTALTDDEGTAVEIAAEPQKIVSLTPAATEILFAIGAGERVVAKVEDVADFPPEASAVPVVATFEGVDTEKIVGLGADLVIAGGNFGTPPDSVAKLRSLGIPVLVVYASDVDGALKDIELIGSAVGAAECGPRSDRGDAGRLRPDQHRDERVDRPRVSSTRPARAMSRSTASPTTPCTRRSSGSPAATRHDRECLELGDVDRGAHRRRPADHPARRRRVRGDADAVAARPGWKVLSAVKDGAIQAVDDIVVTRPGPRLVTGLLALAQAVHPEAALPSLAPVAP